MTARSHPSDFIDNINAWFIRGTGRYFVNPTS